MNGVVSNEFPSAGALLKGSSAVSAELECSGTLIGCQTFLTAAHCVCDTVGSQCQGAHSPDPFGFFVYLQNAGIFSVSSISVRSDFNFPVGDVAVLRLASPVTGIVPSPLNTEATPPFGSAGSIAGFGRSGGKTDNYGVKRLGAVATTSCTSESNSSSVCWAFTAPLGAPGTHSNTCNGDSGGPLFVDLGSGPVVAGVTSGGYRDDCLLGDESYDANVFQYSSWIMSQGGADVGATSCGDLPMVGSAGAEVHSFSGSLVAPASASHSFAVAAGMRRLRVTLNAEADADLYIKAGSAPTTSDYDCRQDGPTGFASCEVANPAATTWYVLVQQYTANGVYQVTATVFGSDCSDPMNAGLVCDDGNSCTSGDVCASGVCAGSPMADDTPCDDGNSCRNPDVCVAGACRGGTSPRIGCHEPFAPPAGLFRVRESSVGIPRLSWRWSKGGATSAAEFGAPTLSTDYDVCVYSQAAATSSLLLQHHVGGGTLCGTQACWKATRYGYRYADHNALNGPITYIELHDGGDGAATVLVRGKGAALGLPLMPIDPAATVTVQLTNGSACWEAAYPVSVKNTSTEYRAQP